jgi:hypothetical protein
MFSDAAVVVDTNGDITIKEEFRWSEGLWDLLMHKNVNK